MRRALYILGELNDEDIVWMASVGERLTVPADHTLIEAGEPVHSLYLVIEGRLTVSLAGGPAIAELGAGDVLGEMSLVEKRPPAVSVSRSGSPEANRAGTRARASARSRCGFPAATR